MKRKDYIEHRVEEMIQTLRRKGLMGNAIPVRDTVEWEMIFGSIWDMNNHGSPQLVGKVKITEGKIRHNPKTRSSKRPMGTPPI
jgi:hypothetical protein